MFCFKTGNRESLLLGFYVSAHAGWSQPGPHISGCSEFSSSELNLKLRMNVADQPDRPEFKSRGPARYTPVENAIYLGGTSATVGP